MTPAVMVIMIAVATSVSINVKPAWDRLVAFMALSASSG